MKVYIKSGTELRFTIFAMHLYVNEFFLCSFAKTTSLTCNSTDLQTMNIPIVNGLTSFLQIVKSIILTRRERRKIKNARVSEKIRKLFLFVTAQTFNERYWKPESVLWFCVFSKLHNFKLIKYNTLVNNSQDWDENVIYIISRKCQSSKDDCEGFMWFQFHYNIFMDKITGKVDIGLK